MPCKDISATQGRVWTPTRFFCKAHLRLPAAKECCHDFSRRGRVFGVQESDLRRGERAAAFRMHVEVVHSGDREADGGVHQVHPRAALRPGITLHFEFDA